MAGATNRRRDAQILVAALIPLLLAPVSANSQASAWGGIDEAQVRLISPTTATGGSGKVTLGLQFRMKKDWKVYWRSPGDAGFPPRLDWGGSRNFKTADIAWPQPIRFSVLGFETVGYHDEVVLPVTAALADPARPASFSLSVDYLACAQICVPANAKLTLELPAGMAVPSEFSGLVAHYAARVPGDGTRDRLAIETVAAGGTKEKPILEIIARSPQPIDSPDVFVEGPPALRFGVPKVALGDGGRMARLSVPVDAAPGAEPKLAGESVTLTLVTGDRSMEKSAVVAAGAVLPEVAESESASQLIIILVLALVGGVILNLMPCVLPVLALKFLGAVESGGKESRAVRTGFLASASGVVAAFMLLAVAAIVGKEAGYLVGWGIQFQQPAFLILMVLLLAIFACNLLGFFEISLPGWMSNIAGRRLDPKTLTGNFLTGAFATVLATPCSAPFLGTALGFALSRGAAEILIVFAALGLGMALPYLAVAAAPGVARLLPRPGPWMTTLKRIFAVALAATALWLLSILAAQSSPAVAVLVGCLAAGSAMALAFMRGGDFWRRGRIATVAVLALLAFAAPVFLTPSADRTAAAPEGLWRNFDPAAIPNLVATGHVVVVDVTADWCLTCKVNEAFVLDTGEIVALLRADNVVAMRADWTRPDDAIARYLASFGRYGIPFNAVYGPGAPQGIALPELLTKDAIEQAIERAAGRDKPVSRARERVAGSPAKG